MNTPQAMIIDYQLSNLFSVKHACEHVGIKCFISSNPKDLLGVDAAILPGVGAYGDAMNNLNKLGLTDDIKKFISRGKHFFGICLGMQLLFSQSEEFGYHKGLDVIRGKIVKFSKKNKNDQNIIIPQIGWNKIYFPGDIDIIKRWLNSPLKQNHNHDYMYFVHSFYAKPDNANQILSLTTYENVEYCSSILSNNIFAVQFHPEKSGQSGLKIYYNWKKMIYDKKT